MALDAQCANRRLSPLYLGWVAVRNGRIVDRRSWLVRTPGRPYRTWEQPREEITRERYDQAPLFVEAWPDMADFIAGRPVVAHGAGHDVGALRRGCDDVGAPWPSLTYACSLQLARRVWPAKHATEHGVHSYTSVGLAYVLFPEAGLNCDEHGIQLLTHHADPLEDAEASARIVLAAQHATGCSSLTEVLTVTGTPLLTVEPDRYQRNPRSWIPRHR